MGFRGVPRVWGFGGRGGGGAEGLSFGLRAIGFRGLSLGRRGLGFQGFRAYVSGFMVLGFLHIQFPKGTRS